MGTSSENLKQRLLAWSSESGGERGEIAKQLAAALDEPELKSRWSLIDIRREIEMRSDGKTSRKALVLNFFSVLHTASYLLPIGFTWFHISGAMREFKKVINQLGTGESANFLSFWSGAENTQYSGMKLQDVGSVIVVLLLVPILLNFFLNYLESKQEKTSVVVNDLILQTQLEFSTARTITPEALADALSDSTTKLETALKQMSTAVETTKDAISAIGKSTGSLETATKNSSTALSDSSSALKTQIENLETSFKKIGEVVENLSSVGADIATAGKTIQKIGNIAESAGHLETAVDNALDSAKEAATGLSKISQSLQTDLSGLGNQLSGQVGAMSTLIESLSKTISPLVSNLGTLGQVTDNNKPAILHLGDVVVATKKVVDEMHSVVREFAIAANSISTTEE